VEPPPKMCRRPGKHWAFLSCLRISRYVCFHAARCAGSVASIFSSQAGLQEGIFFYRMMGFPLGAWGIVGAREFACCCDTVTCLCLHTRARVRISVESGRDSRVQRRPQNLGGRRTRRVIRLLRLFVHRASISGGDFFLFWNFKFFGCSRLSQSEE